ncbi:glycosyltransferase family 4 protein [Roseovarius sp.]|uniref:glycosyltransferase family 4 protein n=1 Tax=Roseovarius sp. TaxID=1486281 RepID=UPI003BA9A606
MKVLLTHRFFWPDTAPYAVMLRAIGNALADAGHKVHVLSSMPSYRSETRPTDTPRRETLGALEVKRIRVLADEKRNPLRRLTNVLLYCWALFVNVLRLRPDVVAASTFPPVAAAWSASFAARLVGSKFVYHMQDIHPEVSIYSGGRLGRGLPMRLMRWLDNQTLRRSSAIVVLSQDMADTLAQRQLGPLPIHVVNNFSLDLSGETEEPPEELRKAPGRRRVIFAGNLGRFQNLPQMTEAVSRLFADFPDLELFFLGSGTALPELKRRWGDHPQIGFGPFLPFSQAKSLIAEADVGLVSLEKNLFRVAYPSKIASYLSLGVPVLALVEPHSAIATQIVDENLGATAPADDPEAVAKALRQLLQGGAHAPRPHFLRSWVQREAVAEELLPHWIDLIHRLEPAPDPSL